MSVPPSVKMPNGIQKEGASDTCLFKVRCNQEDDIGSIGTTIDTMNSAHNSFQIANPSMKTSSFLKSNKNVRPILVGYAFGKKKMSTMGIIMAEASKALSTITAALLDDVVHENGEHEEAQHIEIEESGNSQSKNSLEINPRKRERDEGENLPLYSYDKSQTPRKKMLKSNNLQRKSFPVRILAGSMNDKLDEISWDSDMTPPSLITLNTSYTLASSSKKPFFSPNSITVQNIGVNSISSKWSATSDGCYKIEHDSHNEKLPPKHALKTIRVSFVPLDLDSPLEEQHGGKFDVILHKLTEDILCISKLSPDSVPLSMRSSDTVKISKDSNSSKQKSNYDQQNSHLSKTSQGSLDDSQQQAIARVERLNKYKQNHPCCCLVDHPADIKALMSRADMTYVLSNCLNGVTTKSGIPVRNPLFHVLNDTEEDRKMLERLYHKESDVCIGKDNLPFTFPFIAKPLTAAGTSESHKMGIVLGRKGIPKIEPPCLLQEYSNHDGVLYKVYVLGDLVQVFPRISLPNLPKTECLDKQFSFVEFDSQKTYPTGRDFGVGKEMNVEESLLRKIDLNECASNMNNFSFHSSTQAPTLTQTQSLVTSEEIRPIASVIRNAFGLELFGFDILVINKQEEFSSSKGTKEMLIVDVNYFPSYKEVSEFPSLLAQYLTERAIEGRLQSFRER